MSTLNQYRSAHRSHPTHTHTHIISLTHPLTLTLLRMVALPSPPYISIDPSINRRTNRSSSGGRTHTSPDGGKFRYYSEFVDILELTFENKKKETARKTYDCKIFSRRGKKKKKKKTY